MTQRISIEYVAWLASLLLVALFASMLFGFTGFRSVAAIAFLFVIPVFLLLRKAGLDSEEKVFFSLFIGLGLFPIAAWAVNRVLPSFRLSVLAALALFALASFFLSRPKKLR